MFFHGKHQSMWGGIQTLTECEHNFARFELRRVIHLILMPFYLKVMTFDMFTLIFCYFQGDSGVWLPVRQQRKLFMKFCQSLLMQCQNPCDNQFGHQAKNPHNYTMCQYPFLKQCNFKAYTNQWHNEIIWSDYILFFLNWNKSTFSTLSDQPFRSPHDGHKDS